MKPSSLPRMDEREVPEPRYCGAAWGCVAIAVTVAAGTVVALALHLAAEAVEWLWKR
jgi:hypothetical protein